MNLLRVARNPSPSGARAIMVMYRALLVLLVMAGVTLGAERKPQTKSGPPTGTFTSFEQDSDLSSWVLAGAGTFGRDDSVAKDGASALQWRYQAGDRLRLEACSSFKDPMPWMKVWVYNPVPRDGALTIRVGTSAELDRNDPVYRYAFHLGFRGWRALWISRMDRHPVRPRLPGDPPPDVLEMLPPASVPGGEVFFDNLELGSGRPFAITTDEQFPSLEPKEDTREYRILQRTRDPAQLVPISAEDRADFAIIAKRIDDFLFPSDVDYAALPVDDPLRIRYENLSAAIKNPTEAYDRLALQRHEGGRLTGKPIYGDNDRMKPKFTDFYRDWILMLADVRLRGNEETRGKMLDMLEHFHDQGFASGSGAGSLGIGHLRMDGWAFASYSLRADLARMGRLDDQIATMKWRTLFGLVYEYNPVDLTYSYETDYIRGSMLFQLLAVLMMPDSPEKLLDMRCFVRFAEAVMQPRSGLRGGMKPDHVIYHHNTAYLAAYGGGAINIMAEIAYFLHGTRFALDAPTRASIAASLDAYQVSSNRYSVHLGLCGRMPERSEPLLELIGTFAYLGLTGDRAMGESFLRHWDPRDPQVAAIIPNCLNSINYFTTLGQMNLIRTAAREFPKAGWQPRATPQGAWVFPYGSYAVLRRADWMVSVRAFSRQAFNYEYGIDGEPQNLWGKYANFGTTLIYGKGGAVGSGLDTARGWDWSRWPGATAINLPLGKLEAAKHHVYGTEAFVGGLAAEDGIGLFAARLKDPTDEHPLRADKSWFLFGDQVVCLGSGITTEESQHPAETTLFQTTLGDRPQQPMWIGSPSPITEAEWQGPVLKAGSLWLVDPLGNGYTLPDARNLQVRRGRQESKTPLGVASEGPVAVAWLDHGLQPAGASYHYVIHPQQSPKEVARRLEHPDYAVLRHDSQAHVVQHQGGRLIGYVLFDSAVTFEDGIIRSVDTPCLVVDRRLDNQHHRLSVADPDLRMGRTPTYASRAITPHEIVPSQAHTLQIILRGRWNLAGPVLPGVRVEDGPEAGTTILLVETIDGRTRTIDLALIHP